MSRSPVSVRVHAPAKINLTLRVLGVHADGYHELRTIFQSLALHDTLTFRAIDGPFSIVCDDPACPADQSNLVWKAADALWRAGKRRGPVSNLAVQIHKAIPQQAGLGGGSSDAAATLRALTRLWRLPVSGPSLRAVAREVGADVGFFLEGGTALGVERGDLLFSLVDQPPSEVVIVRPDFGVSSRDAYKWWDAAHRERPPVLTSGDLALEWTNDLQAPVAERHPAILRLVNRLRRAGATCAAMSGSGSAVFGLFESRARSQQAARALAGRGLSVFLTRTLSRRGYQRLAAPR